MRRHMIRWAFLAAILAVSLGSAEAWLRLTDDREALVHPDASGAYLGHVEATDADGFRVGLQPANPDLAAIGDSLTFGRGVPAEQTWPVVLAGLTGKRVANLGRSGENGQGFLAQLARVSTVDRVLYAACPNDVAPSGKSCSDIVPRDLWERSALLARADAGRNARWIARCHEQRRAKWKRDTRRVYEAAVAKSRQPPLALVVTNPGREYPETVAAIEDDLRAAGWGVLPSGYLAEHAGEDWSVSPHDGHPNARGHEVYARTFAEAIR